MTVRGRRVAEIVPAGARGDDAFASWWQRAGWCRRRNRARRTRRVWPRAMKVHRRSCCPSGTLSADPVPGRERIGLALRRRGRQRIVRDALHHSDGWFICRIGFVETIRAVSLAGGAPASKSVRREWPAFGIVEVDERLSEHAASLTLDRDLLTLDALHLAAALVLPPSGLVFATWDRRLHAAAGAEGLELLPAALSYGPTDHRSRVAPPGAAVCSRESQPVLPAVSPKLAPGRGDLRSRRAEASERCCRRMAPT